MAIARGPLAVPPACADRTSGCAIAIRGVAPTVANVLRVPRSECATLDLPGGDRSVDRRHLCGGALWRPAVWRHLWRRSVDRRHLWRCEASICRSIGDIRTTGRRRGCCPWNSADQGGSMSLLVRSPHQSVGRRLPFVGACPRSPGRSAKGISLLVRGLDRPVGGKSWGRLTAGQRHLFVGAWSPSVGWSAAFLCCVASFALEANYELYRGRRPSLQR